MIGRTLFFSTSSVLCFVLFVASHLVAQEPPQPTPRGGQEAGTQQGPGRNGDRRPGLFGKITAIHDQSVELSSMGGGTVTVKIGAETQFRKERETAKLADFKVGDIIFVRGEENPDHTWNAQMIGARPNGEMGGPGAGGAGRGGPGGAAGQGMRQMGVLGQDYIAGEIKAVNAPSLTILRPDNVTQAVELNEETSLHKGREAITMADIQAGDHVFIRGAMVNNAFQPKNVMVIGPEQWKRMQEMGLAGGGNAPNGQPPKPPQDKPQDNKPQNPGPR